MCAVRCVCMEGAPAPGRRQGAGDGDGQEGDPGGEPEFSSLLQPSWLAGDRGALGHCCSSCAGQSALVTTKDAGCQGSSGAQCPVNLPQLPHHLQPELSCQLCLCSQTPFLGLLLSRDPSPGVCSAGPCLPCPCLSCGCAWLWGSIPAAPLRQTLAPVCVPGARCSAADRGCLMEQRRIGSCCFGPLQLPGDGDRTHGIMRCTLVLARQGRRAQVL